jgi:hypothetical protein
MAEPTCKVTPSPALPVITAEFRLTVLCIVVLCRRFVDLDLCHTLG